MTWTLPQLTEACRSAPAVFLALLDLSRAGGSPVVTAGRDKIAAACGIDRLKTISEALTALERGGWVQRIHKFTTANGGATLLKVIIAHPAYRGGNRPLRKSRIGAKNAPFHRGEKRPLSFPSEKGAHGSASAPPTGTPTPNTERHGYDDGGPIVHSGSLPR